MELRDIDLIARVLADDDRHAFGELVRRHQSAVRGFLRRLTRGDHAQADDLAQDTFLTAYRALANFHGGASFSTWLLGIAHNRFRQERRRTRPTEPWNGDVTLIDAASDIATSTPEPARAIALHHDLTAALARLSDDERAAIHLCYDSGLTHEEAAIALACPLGTLKSHLARGKEKLRLHLSAWNPVASTTLRHEA